MTTTPTMLGNRLTAFDIVADGRAPGTRGLEDLFHERPLPYLPAGKRAGPRRSGNPMSTKSLADKQPFLARAVVYLLAFLVPPVLVSVVGVKTAESARYEGPTATARIQAGELPAPPGHDPDKPTAVVLLSNQGSEVTDVLAPYEVLSETAMMAGMAVLGVALAALGEPPGYDAHPLVRYGLMGAFMAAPMVG
jgi:hypothetical protein